MNAVVDNASRVDSRDSDFDAFSKLIVNRVNSLDSPLYVVDSVTRPFMFFLETQYGGDRQYHNCSACRQFFEHAGQLVVIDAATGKTKAALWDLDIDDVPSPYKSFVAVEKSRLADAKVAGIFKTASAVTGLPVAGGHRHFHFKTPAANLCRNESDVRKSAAQIKHRFETVRTALSNYPVDLLRKAVSFLKTDALYRSEKVLPPAEWLLETAEGYSRKNTYRDNYLWRRVTDAPEGFCHPRTTMVGTLLDDLAEGVPADVAQKRFAEKMHPLQYLRPQAPPSEGNVLAARKALTELGYAPSLERRFATLDDVRPYALWLAPEPKADAGGLFAGVPTKSAAKASVQAPLQATSTITGTKFVRQHLPEAKRISIQIPSNGNFSAIVGPVHADAPVIFRWGHPYSWYVYHGGMVSHNFSCTRGAFMDVTAVTTRPEFWAAPGAPFVNDVTQTLFFVIRDAVDNFNNALALFPECLRQELHAYRSTIEAYSKMKRLEGQSQASACGLVLSQHFAPLRVRVEKRDGTVYDVMLDRWD